MEPPRSLLPAIANWFAPVVRGLLALAPPPPPPPYPSPGIPCPGVPSAGSRGSANTLNCGRCIELFPSDYIPYQDGQASTAGGQFYNFWHPGVAYSAGNVVVPNTYNGFVYRAQNSGTSASNASCAAGSTAPFTCEPKWPARLAATVSDNFIVWKAEPEPLCGFVDSDNDGNPDVNNPGTRNAWPLLDRGFDDPQADPDPGFVFSGNTCGPKKDKPCKVYFIYRRADLWNFPVSGATIYPYRQKANDSDNGNPPWGSQPNGDVNSNPPNDNDSDALTDDGTPPDRHNRGSYAAVYNSDRYQFAQQAPNDAFAEPSHPLPIQRNCDVYQFGHPCGGLALYKCGGQTPCEATATKADSTMYVPYAPGTEPPAPESWPLVPIPRDWTPYKNTDGDSATAIKRLLRFASSIVSFDSTQPYMNEYSLAEDASNVVVTAPGTPIAGALRDAYLYFKNTILAQQDPFISCRLNKVILITDGLESANGAPCAGGPTGKGPAGDLFQIGVPVIVVGMGLTSQGLSTMNCIAANSGGQLIPANNRDDLISALQGATASTSTVGPRSIAAPALPALASAAGDTAIVGSVIPSHKSPPEPDGDGANTQWAIWNGSLKAYKLDSNGMIPTVTETSAPTTTAATPNPSATPTPPPSSNGFPDETAPTVTPLSDRKPVWNAGRVLGYTDPVATPAAGAAAVNPCAPDSSPCSASGNAFLTVWPGRRMFWADGTGPTVPLSRTEFTCPADPNPCTGNLIQALGLNPGSDKVKAKQTVQFLRGGKSISGSRDEVLTDVGTINPGTYGAVDANTVYSYRYRDDVPAGNPPEAQTDGGNPAYYSHKLGEIFHSETAVVLPPKYFQYLSVNLNPRPGNTCGALPDCSYTTFAAFHGKRRKVALVGSNDGFFHAFDSGVWGRDTTQPDAFDLGTGREIFAYAPQSVMPQNGSKGFPSLLNFPPKVQYFVDGSPRVADVFIDTNHSGTPNPDNRTWKTVAMSGLRQGGHAYFALDVTQPDLYAADGTKLASDKDSFPDCIDGAGNCPDAYPKVLWEMSDSCTSCNAPMGETWSRPVIGRIRVNAGGSNVDRYVAIFGGGFDPNFVPGTELAANDQTTQGGAIYIVDMETGKVLYKGTAGPSNRFAPIAAPPAVADVDDDGYLDIVYFGDLNGRMWRMSLSGATCSACGSSTETISSGLNPTLLYDPLTGSLPIQPIFLEPAVIFISGGGTPILGVAWGTGYRAELLQANANVNRFMFVIDPGTDNITLGEGNLVDITPVGALTPAGTGPAVTGPCNDTGQTNCGYFLDYFTANEKAVSTVFSSLGNLELVTFAPSSTQVLCGNGNSFRYSFNYLTGRGAYNAAQAMGTAGQMTDYQQSLGDGLVAAAQSQGPSGAMIDSLLYDTGAVNQQKSGSLKALSETWKEQ